MKAAKNVCTNIFNCKWIASSVIQKLTNWLANHEKSNLPFFMFYLQQ